MSCDKCSLREGICVPGDGPSSASLVIVGEAPGEQELRLKKPFVGASGRLLDSVLKQAGIAREDVYIDNSVSCMILPPRTPTAKEVTCCKERLIESIKSRKPAVVLALGKIAMKALLGINKPIGEERGAVHYADHIGAHVLVTYHPAAVLRSPRLHRGLLNDVAKAKSLVASPTVSIRSPISITYDVIDSADALGSFLAQTDRSPAVALDVENARDGSLLCLGLSLEPGRAAVVTNNALAGACSKLSSWLSNKRCVGQNLKHDIKVLWRNGISGASTGGDTMLQAYVLDMAVGGHGLKTLVREHLDFYEDYSAPLDKYKNAGFEHCPPDILHKYNAYDAALTLILEQTLETKLDHDDKRVLSTLLYPASNALAEMEYLGIGVDSDYLRQLDAQLETEVSDLTRQLHDVAGMEFNPNSVPQLLDVMYKRLELPIPARLSTDKDALELLAEVCGHPFPKLMLQYRARKKFHSTTVRGLLNAVDGYGRVRTTFNLHVTVTGRLSSSHPVNLQNVGREAEARNIFVPTPGYTLIEVDLEQAEVRGWCWLSRDEALRAAIVSGVDLHTATACLMFGLKPEEVTKEQRTAAKRLTFGNLYQMSPQTLASELGVSVPEAVELQRKFFATYKRGYEWIHEIQQQCMRDRVYKTHFGRKLRFAVTPATVSEAMRDFVNYPIQNLASDITLSALIRVHKRIKHGDFGNTRLLLTVHDSLLLETAENAELVAHEVKKEVERDVLDGWLPFVADAKIGHAWGSLKKIA